MWRVVIHGYPWYLWPCGLLVMQTGHSRVYSYRMCSLHTPVNCVKHREEQLFILQCELIPPREHPCLSSRQCQTAKITKGNLTPGPRQVHTNVDISSFSASAPIQSKNSSPFAPAVCLTAPFGKSEIASPAWQFCTDPSCMNLARVPSVGAFKPKVTSTM